MAPAMTYALGLTGFSYNTFIKISLFKNKKVKSIFLSEGFNLARINKHPTLQSGLSAIDSHLISELNLEYLKLKDAC
jgi:hypothetical protein